MVIVIAVLTFPIWITVAATLFGLIVAAFWRVVRMCSGRHCRNSGTSDIRSGINWHGNRWMYLRKYCSGNPCDGSRIFRNGNRNPFIDLCCMDLWRGSSDMLPLDR